jgi:hypothetical protein
VTGVPRMGIAGIAAVCVLVAGGLLVDGCSVAAPPASPAASGYDPGVAPAQKSRAECFLLSGAEMRAAVGTPVGPGKPLLPGVCVHQLPHAVGTLDYGVTTFSSAAHADGDLRFVESSDVGTSGLRVVPIRGLGREAFALLSSQGGDFARVVVGSKELEVSLSWNRATYRMVVTLTREAFRRMCDSTCRAPGGR